jgi:hypothetical protein
MYSRLYASFDRLSATARAWPRATWLALGVAVAALVLRLFGLTAPVDNYDEGVYVASLRLLAHGTPLYRPLGYLQPPFFLFALLPWFMAFGQTLFAARLGVVIYSMLGLGAAWWIGRALGGPRAALLAVLLLGVDPLYLSLSRSVEAEVPCLAWALVALAAAVWHARQADRRLALLAGAALSAAVLTKLAGILVLPTVLWFLLQPAWATATKAGASPKDQPAQRLFPAPRDLWHAARLPLLWFGIGLVALTLLILAPIVPQWGAFWQQVFQAHVNAENLPGFSRSGNIGTIAGAWWEAPVLALALGVLFAGIRRRDGATIGLGLWFTLTLITLLVQSPLFAHHVVLLVVPLILLAALVPETLALPLLRGLGSTTQRVLVVGAVVLVGLVTDVAQQNAQLAQPPISLLVAAQDLDTVTQPGDLVITDDQIIAVLANRDVPPTLADTSLVRIAAGSLTAQDVEAAARDPHVTAILWYSGRFDHLPGLREWLVARYVEVIDYGGGRGLYVRGNPTMIG